MNNRPEDYTREVAFDDLVLGQRYKLLFSNGHFYVGTYVSDTHDKLKRFEFIGPDGRKRITGFGRDPTVRYFEKPFEARKHALAAWTATTGYNIRKPRKSRKSRGSRRSTRRRRI